MSNEFNHHTSYIIAKIMTFRNKQVLTTMFRTRTCNEVMVGHCLGGLHYEFLGLEFWKPFLTTAMRYFKKM
jgi:hypothetical protein